MEISEKLNLIEQYFAEAIQSLTSTELEENQKLIVKGRRVAALLAETARICRELADKEDGVCAKAGDR